MRQFSALFTKVRLPVRECCRLEHNICILVKWQEKIRKEKKQDLPQIELRLSVEVRGMKTREQLPSTTHEDTKNVQRMLNAVLSVSPNQDWNVCLNNCGTGKIIIDIIVSACWCSCSSSPVTPREDDHPLLVTLSRLPSLFFHCPTLRRSLSRSPLLSFLAVSGRNVAIHTHVTILWDKRLISYRFKTRWITYSVILFDLFGCASWKLPSTDQIFTETSRLMPLNFWECLVKRCLE